MSTAAKLSLAQYEFMADQGAFDGRFHQRVELIRGELRQMNPIGIRHARAVNYLTEWSIRSLPAERAWVAVQNPIRAIQVESVPEPDIAWVARKDYGRHPGSDDVFLLIEVADTTVEYDCGEKAQLYAEAGIRDYWVLDIEHDLVKVHRRPDAGGYLDVGTYRAGDELRPIDFPAVVLELSVLVTHLK
jgi:Uma2 family endonuclease